MPKVNRQTKNKRVAIKILQSIEGVTLNDQKPDNSTRGGCKVKDVVSGITNGRKDAMNIKIGSRMKDW